jgi:hypothetical protein
VTIDATIEAAECGAVRRAMVGSMVGGGKISRTRDVQEAGSKRCSQRRSQSRSQRATTVHHRSRNRPQQAACRERERAADVLLFFEDKGVDFNYVNFATSLHRLGFLGRSFEKSSRPLLQKLGDRATSSINDSKQWGSRELSNA